MSLILDALKKAKLLTQGRHVSPEAQNLIKSFGFSKRTKRPSLRRAILYVVPALVLASGMAVAANYWLKAKSRGTMAVARDVELPSGVPTPDPAPVEPPATPPAEPAAAPPPAPVAAPVVAAVPAPAPSRPAVTNTQPPATSVGPQARTTTPTAQPSRPATPPVETSPAMTATNRSDPTPPPTPVPAPTTTATPPAIPPATPAAPRVSVPSETAAGDPAQLIIDYFNAGQFHKALEQCPRAKQLRPREASVFLNCAASHLVLENFAEAITELTIAARLKPGDAKIFINLGIAYMGLNENASARNAFERAIRLEPSNADAYYQRGLIAKVSAQAELAKSDFLKATQLADNHAKASFQLARIYDQQGETGPAIQYYEKFFELAQGLPEYNADVNLAQARIQELTKKLPKN